MKKFLLFFLILMSASKSWAMLPEELCENQTPFVMKHAYTQKLLSLALDGSVIGVDDTEENRKDARTQWIFPSGREQNKYILENVASSECLIGPGNRSGEPKIKERQEIFLHEYLWRFVKTETAGCYQLTSTWNLTLGIDANGRAVATQGATSNAERWLLKSISEEK